MPFTLPLFSHSIYVSIYRVQPNTTQVGYGDKHVHLRNEIEWNSPLMCTAMKAIIGQPIHLSLCVYDVYWKGIGISELHVR
jgi:hypothetical protein